MTLATAGAATLKISVLTVNFNTESHIQQALDSLRAQSLPADTQAVLCFNDLVALGLMNGLARQGRRVGQDIRLVGFDNIEECAEVWPALSSVSCDIARFGHDTAGRLLGWLNRGVVPSDEIRAPVGLIARASSLGIDHG